MRVPVETHPKVPARQLQRLRRLWRLWREAAEAAKAAGAEEAAPLNTETSATFKAFREPRQRRKTLWVIKFSGGSFTDVSSLSPVELRPGEQRERENVGAV